MRFGRGAWAHVPRRTGMSRVATRFQILLELQLNPEQGPDVLSLQSHPAARLEARRGFRHVERTNRARVGSRLFTRVLSHPVAGKHAGWLPPKH